MVKTITTRERGEIENIISHEINRAYTLYPKGFEINIHIKSEAEGDFYSPHYVDLVIQIDETTEGK